jgi:hypothetical protein
MKNRSLVGRILGRIIVVEKESLSSILLRTATSSQTQSQFEKGRNDGVECCRVYDLLPNIADERQCIAGGPTNQSPNSGLRVSVRTLARCAIASYVLPSWLLDVSARISCGVLEKACSVLRFYNLLSGLPTARLKTLFFGRSFEEWL